ncbi:unnamed protein product [Closterium sp. Naga37s-1]|nr:unnamed protein product [Closterium sp. Naga37s-1]
MAAMSMSGLGHGLGGSVGASLASLGVSGSHGDPAAAAAAGAGMAGLAGMAGVAGMGGMGGMAGMAGITGMTGMAGMTAMAGMAGMAGTSAWMHHGMHPPGAVSLAARGGGAASMGAMAEGLMAGVSQMGGGTSAAGAMWMAQAQRQQSTGNASEQRVRATPDFAEVYRFIGLVFDPSTSGHLAHLKAMAPIDRETVLLLMRNLSMNLANPEFQQHVSPVLLLDSVPLCHSTNLTSPE